MRAWAENPSVVCVRVDIAFEFRRSTRMMTGNEILLVGRESTLKQCWIIRVGSKVGFEGMDDDEPDPGGFNGTHLEHQGEPVGGFQCCS